MSLFESDKPKANPAEACTVPGCTVCGPPPNTCVTWGHRVCYRHFAGFYVWSEAHGVINRAPTDNEWAGFIRGLAMEAA